jgi:hypothetical protein
LNDISCFCFSKIFRTKKFKKIQIYYNYSNLFRSILYQLKEYTFANFPISFLGIQFLSDTNLGLWKWTQSTLA